jgi:hypothetical protein
LRYPVKKSYDSPTSNELRHILTGLQTKYSQPGWNSFCVSVRLSDGAAIRHLSHCFCCFAGYTAYRRSFSNLRPNHTTSSEQNH